MLGDYVITLSNVFVCDPGIDLLDPVAAVEALEDAWLLPLLLLLLVLRGRDVRERRRAETFNTSCMTCTCKFTQTARNG